MGLKFIKHPEHFRTIANYVTWRITGFSSYFLTEQLRKRQLQYSTAISGKQEQEPRWKECIDLASGSLSTGSGSLYVRKYFKKDSKSAALEMVIHIILCYLITIILFYNYIIIQLHI